MNHPMSYEVSRLSEMDIYLFKQGTHTNLYNKLGSHSMVHQGDFGIYFSVWAPNAAYVSVRGDFNNYDTQSHPLKLREDESGIWEGFISGVEQGLTYKYHIVSKFHNIIHDKSDPFGFYAEMPPKSASRVWKIDDYGWEDSAWMASRYQHNAHDAPISVYEVHLGSWRRHVEEGDRYLTYRELAVELVEYLKEMNYTHVEFMPLTEYPFFGSWGYQVVGYFAATARFGTPQDLMYLIDTLHQNGIGVIMDWVPSHFAVDMHGLINFDGTALYEHDDPRQGFHPEWGSIIFNYGRNEVQSFLISSAMFWVDYYHIDGIRVDAVASMLYLNYARKEGEWIPNQYGGNENLEAIEFLKKLNTSLYGAYPDIVMIAEESTAYPMVTRPVDVGGLGFGFKWNMGWMHDSLKYMSYNPFFRQHHHHQLTFSMWYGFDENFMLPLSHDEVVHMKGSLINKMPGDTNQKFANLRALYAYMMAHPGKKLLFMGGEIAQYAEWNFERSLDWHLCDFPLHAGLQKMVAELNSLYRRERALHLYDEKREGFEWIDDRDSSHNCLSFIRKSDNPDENIYVVCNFADETRYDFPVGVVAEGEYVEIFNSQSLVYEGWNIHNSESIISRNVPIYGKEFSITMTLPPLGVVYLKKLISKEEKL
ncbi:MAG: 1,4-alpha-glucan branching protein GlgB [Sulfuricurvum sp.]|uniref:1,4-alpha-glucan branching protein GlgB n=1 Tax=Sulfuricurvum sp. TaxID=2025608 RepID=UPI002603D67A|nr:1,4-alpha-glucan branching protein GlgB [Sulfuricurvum sp.]MDD2829487.1 1,4-alpha-glucan branching protein GlgB [Sulfuricurvum sp.]MDD4949516.1 1,4-alpha-glucan branching protein GlgB [Sulfuricurvum sp.]